VAALLGLGGIAAIALAAMLAMGGARYAVARALGVPGVGLFSAKGKEPVSRRAIAAIVAAGAAAVYLVSAALFVAALLVDGQATYGTVVQVIHGRPAEAAGIRDGDRVVTIAGAKVESWDAIAATLHARPGLETEIVVARDGAEVRVVVTPGGKGTPGEGKIGIAARPIRSDVSIGAALHRGLEAPIIVLAEVYRALAQRTARTEAAGPVGIVRETAGARTGSALATLGSIAAFFWPLGAGLSFIGLTGRRRPGRKTAA